MQKIPVKLAAPGMILAKPVVRDNGITLVGEGVELTESLIARFEQSGVGSVTVQGNPVQMDGLAGGTDFGRRAERMEHLFRKHGDDPFMMTMKKVLVQYFRLKAASAAAAAAAERVTDENGGAPEETGRGNEANGVNGKVAPGSAGRAKA
ncbi:hypothetical protein [Desulfovibrio psychrotolerans]|uniref:Uncharacterized protein n=1 Tax=Desulfovibrio psychrotolerans TaxID=415242 RepID=A0A7J0BPQ6_9BACT|nr:hypothetical protein [Desulfovibrio psychrotolerans]GFM35686.1 hypothetical protein DSM19430T_03700 [Desulfovibrio psychrotolerans]